ncbi:hypothetical protein RND81_10G124600 [Saponaria officinalis]|uniref:GRF-type domain-containing protein n=1 Tax=Saponaria officinalis TaxID=3572 RepID=A0AAW1I3T1_SAPOF
MSLSNGSSSSTNERLKCHCGIRAAIKTAWTVNNPGRRFVSCKFYNPKTSMRGCRFFKWVDEDNTEWQRKLVNEMLNENMRLKNEVNRQQQLLDEGVIVKKSANFGEEKLQSKCEDLIIELKLLKRKVRDMKIILVLILVVVVFYGKLG